MVIVFGATGTVGRQVVTQLAEGGIPSRAVSRRADVASAGTSEVIEWVRADLGDPGTLDRVLEGVDRVFLVTGGQAMLLEGNLLAAAGRAGVTHVVRMSGSFLVGPDATVGFDRAHYRAEQALERSGLAWTHLRPSYFMQNLLIQGASGTLALPFGDARVNLVDTRDIAAVAVAALTGAGHEGQTYPVSGPEALTFTQVAATLSTVTGRPFSYRPVGREEFAATLQQWGLPATAAADVAEEYTVIGRHHPAFEQVTDTVPRLTGRPGISLARFAADHAAALTGPRTDESSGARP
jgi:uncharacterized protein YbjT (DUF2867 family)